MQIISSKENRLFKSIKSLKLRKNRKKLSQFYVEGYRIVSYCIENNIMPDYILVRDDQEVYQTEFEAYNTIILTSDLFDDISDTVNSQGVIGVFSTDVLKSKINGDVVLVCENLQDPGNLGTIIRTCDAMGVDTLILTKGCADVFNPKVTRSTMGSLFNINIVKEVELVDLCNELKNLGYTLIGTDLNTDKTHFEINNYDKVAIFMGNEGNGLSKEALDSMDLSVIIPMIGNPESLNVSMAATILLYEVSRSSLINL